MFAHVGLLFNEPPGSAGLSFTKSSDYLHHSFYPLDTGITRITRFEPGLFRQDCPGDSSS